MDNLNQIIDFFIEVDKLKNSIRFNSAPDFVRESSSDHTWKMALMAIEIAKEFDLNLDMMKALKIILVHDLCEYAEGDYDSYYVRIGKFTAEEKSEGEEKTMESLREKYPFSKELYDLWKEYDDNKTYEAKFAKALDKLECLTHLLNVGYAGEEELIRFHTATYADKAVSDFAELKPFLKEIKKKLRIMFEKKGYDWKGEYNLHL